MTDPQTDRVVANAQTSAAHGSTYDEFWKRLSDTDYNTGYARVRKDFIDYAMKKWIRPQQPLTILDLGCGTGWLTDFLASYGSATGVDFAPETLQQAQQMYGQRAEYKLADPASPTLGLPSDQRFDVVVASEVIEHVEDHNAFMKQVRGFLRPGGWFILTTPNRRYWEAYQRNERFIKYGQPIENWLNVEECRALLRQHGFTLHWEEGWPDVAGYDLLNRLADNRYTRKLAKVLGVYHPYARLLLPFSMYQMSLGRKN